MRIPLALVFLLIAVLGWAVRQHASRKRLRELDEGRRCIACDRTDMHVESGRTRCRTCGHTVELQALQAVKVTAAEMSHLNQPVDPRD